MAQNNYYVEYATTGRATCKNKKCGKKIDKDILRIGKRFPSARFTDDGEQTDWYHWNCVFDALSRARKTTKRIESVDDLVGFNGLADAEQKLLKKAIEQNIYPSPGGEGNSGTSSSTTNSKSEKPKTKSKKTKMEAWISGPGGVEIGPISSKFFVGRGSNTSVFDKKVSKHQVELNGDNDFITVSARGINPIFIMKKGEKNRNE